MVFFFPVPISQKPLRIFSVPALQILGFLSFASQFLFNIWLFLFLIVDEKISLKRVLYEVGSSLVASFFSWIFVSLATAWIFKKNIKLGHHFMSCLIIHILLLFLQLVYLRFLLFEELFPRVYVINDIFINGTSSIIGGLLASADFGAYLLAPKRRHTFQIRALVILSGYLFLGTFTVINITCTPVLWYFRDEKQLETLVFFLLGGSIFLFLLILELVLCKRDIFGKKTNYKQVWQQTDRDQNPTGLLQYTTESAMEDMMADALKLKSHDFKN